ncbi:MAG: hypothetical protein LBR87_07775 [Synergistaceae bacterium]|jgi:hypothetical protein|nr:hypothetical protein [Synergistaceae bacterium]
MQALLILALIIAVITFLAPFILSALIFFICAVLVLLLLARFGLLPGAGYKRYGADIDDRSPGSLNRKRRFIFEKEEKDWKESRGWNDHDEEEIILPETALRKEDAPRKGRNR